MFWSAESGSGIADMVSGGSAQIRCNADLKANGEEKNTIKPLVFFTMTICFTPRWFRALSL
jgi:hypothetical protein